MTRSVVILWMLLSSLFINDVAANSGAIYSWNMRGATAATADSKYGEVSTILNGAQSPDIFCLQEAGDMPQFFEAQNGEFANQGTIIVSNKHKENNFYVWNTLFIGSRNGSVYTGVYLDPGQLRNKMAIFVRGDVLKTKVIDLNQQTRPILALKVRVCGVEQWIATLHSNSGNSNSPPQANLIRSTVDQIIDELGTSLPLNIIGDFNLNLNEVTPPVQLVNGMPYGRYVPTDRDTRFGNGTSAKLDFLFTSNAQIPQQGTVVTDRRLSNSGISDHEIICYGSLSAGGGPGDDTGDTSPGDVALITRTFQSQTDANTFYNSGRIYYTGITTFLPFEAPTCLPNGNCQVKYIVMEADPLIDVSKAKALLESNPVAVNKITLYENINYQGRAVSFSPDPNLIVNEIYTANHLEASGFAYTGLSAASSIEIVSDIMVKLFDDRTNSGMVFGSGGFLFRLDVATSEIIPDLTKDNVCDLAFDCALSPTRIFNDKISSLSFNSFFSTIHVTGAGAVKLGGTLDLSDRLKINGDLKPGSTTTWVSRDQSLATVDENGLVTANATTTGETKIEILVNPGDTAIATYTLRVTDAQFNSESGIINTGETLDLNNLLRVEPEVVRKEFKWASKDTTLVTVDENGLVTANDTKLGTTKITAGVEYSGIYLSFQLTVTKPGQIDFDLDDKGNALQPGTTLNDQYDDFTVHSTSSRRWPMLFNTANPTSNDFDIGTPNQTYGGNGIGAGGVSNSTAQGNALVVSKHATIPNETEGRLFFDFKEKVTINSIDLLDMKCGDSNIELYNEQNELIRSLPIPAYGVNSFNTFSVNTAGVQKMAVNLACGGGITGFNYCKDEATSTTCVNNSNCVPANLLNFIVGDDYVIARFDNPGTATIAYSKIGDTNFKSINTKLGMNHIPNLKPCTDYQLKTSISCENDEIKESALRYFTTDDCAGLNKEDLNADAPPIQLFPNPVSDVLNINYGAGAGERLVIYNAVGKQVANIPTNSSGETALNVQQYVPGIYMIVSAGYDKMFGKKFVVK